MLPLNSTPAPTTADPLKMLVLVSRSVSVAETVSPIRPARATHGVAMTTARSSTHRGHDPIPSSVISPPEGGGYWPGSHRAGFVPACQDPVFSGVRAGSRTGGGTTVKAFDSPRQPPVGSKPLNVPAFVSEGADGVVKVFDKASPRSDRCSTVLLLEPRELLTRPAVLVLRP